MAKYGIVPSIFLSLISKVQCIAVCPSYCYLLSCLYRDNLLVIFSSLVQFYDVLKLWQYGVCIITAKSRIRVFLTDARTCGMANCQYGCEVMKGEVRCQCPSPGLQLAPDGRTCVGMCSRVMQRFPRSQSKFIALPFYLLGIKLKGLYWRVC